MAPRKDTKIYVEDSAPIEKILKCRSKKRKKEYLVQWEGYSPEYNSWRRAVDVTSDMKKLFHQEQALAKKERKRKRSLERNSSKKMKTAENPQITNNKPVAMGKRNQMTSTNEKLSISSQAQPQEPQQCPVQSTSERQPSPVPTAAMTKPSSGATKPEGSQTCPARNRSTVVSESEEKVYTGKAEFQIPGPTLEGQTQAQENRAVSILLTVETKLTIRGFSPPGENS